MSIFLVLAVIQSGCGFARSAARSASANAVEGLVTSLSKQSDPELVRQGLPTILLLLDGLVESSPEDPQLLRSATNAYTSYCQAFLFSEEDNDRAIKLYGWARGYGLRLLRQRPFYAAALEGSSDEYDAAIQQFTVDDVPDMHAASAAWLGWIIADNQSMDALADLPRALALTQRVLELDEGYGDGSGHLVFGLYYAVQPRGAGQDLEKSKHHFERAIELAGPGNLLPRVLYAEHYGKVTLDQDFFVSTLNDVLATDPEEHPDRRLLNELARERAESLLAAQEDLF